ncbi:MAG: hypothetical protein DHS20C17_17770 [Cyclobacteriaceae bacterium]|nr:MAG: hypothetical protein DHS20C17_17770 [Cyclobacteriaceae bacterium]
MVFSWNIKVQTRKTVPNKPILQDFQVFPSQKVANKIIPDKTHMSFRVKISMALESEAFVSTSKNEYTGAIIKCNAGV